MQDDCRDDEDDEGPREDEKQDKPGFVSTSHGTTRVGE